MKRARKKTSQSKLTLAVGRTLRRAAKVARKTARAYGTPIYLSKSDVFV